MFLQKVPYRSYYPNCEEKEWQVKNGTGKERIIKLVTLSDEKVEISDIWRTEEIEEIDDPKQLNMGDQKLNKPFLKQIYDCVDSKESVGASQTNLASELGVTKLIGRTLVRNLVKSKIVSTYLDDVGRQRTTKFVSKKFHAQSSIRKQFDSEISKIKEFSQAIKNNEALENAKISQNGQCDQVDQIELERETSNDSSKELRHKSDDLIVKVEYETNVSSEKLENISNELQDEMKDLSKKLEREEKNLLEKNADPKFKDQTYALVNKIFRKYKLFKSRNRFLRYSKDPAKISELKKSFNHRRKYDLRKKGISTSSYEIKKNNDKSSLSKALEFKDSKYKSIQLIDSNFYKTIETSLIVQKPECKKKSQKVAVVGFLDSFNNSKNIKNSGVSYRLLRRANMVISSVREHKIIEDIHKLMKVKHFLISKQTYNLNA